MDGSVSGSRGWVLGKRALVGYPYCPVGCNYAIGLNTTGEVNFTTTPVWGVGLRCLSLRWRSLLVAILGYRVGDEGVEVGVVVAVAVAVVDDGAALRGDDVQAAVGGGADTVEEVVVE